jgi:hypothetical protein
MLFFCSSATSESRCRGAREGDLEGEEEIEVVIVEAVGEASGVDVDGMEIAMGVEGDTEADVEGITEIVTVVEEEVVVDTGGEETSVEEETVDATEEDGKATVDRHFIQDYNESQTAS